MIRSTLRRFRLWLSHKGRIRAPVTLYLTGSNEGLGCKLCVDKRQDKPSIFAHMVHGINHPADTTRFDVVGELYLVPGLKYRYAKRRDPEDREHIVVEEYVANYIIMYSRTNNRMGLSLSEFLIKILSDE